MPSLRGWLVAACVVLFAAVGCARKGGLETAPVSGKVTYKGKPLPNGTVMFVPSEGPAATGEIAADGTYHLTTYAPNDGAVLGKHQISITATVDQTNLLPEKRNPLPPSLLPDKYGSHDLSGLTAEVVRGQNEVNLDLPK